MDEIKTRLQETSENCFKAFEAWSGDKKDSSLRETLQEAVHELRKVASRLEIEMAVSERGNGAQKPMPIPSHRDSKRPGGNKGGNNGNKADNAGNTHSVADGLKPRKSGGGRRRSSGSGGNK